MEQPAARSADQPSAPRRHRRRRPAEGAGPETATTGGPAAPAAPAATKADDATATPVSVARRPRRRSDARSEAREGFTERSLRELAGPTRSLLGPEGAMRARDVNRPTEDDLAEAERTVSVVRRRWQPPN